jgi:hypothetical protein
VIIDYPKKNFNLLLDARADALPYDVQLEFFALVRRRFSRQAAAIVSLQCFNNVTR